MILWRSTSAHTEEPRLIDSGAIVPAIFGSYAGLPDSIPNPSRGKDVWKINGCGVCHAQSMKDVLTGPALGGVTERWAAHPREDLYTWIQSSQKLIGEGHPRAIAVWNEWKPTVMPIYPDLTDEECADLLAYIEVVYADY
ncbi:c-type cytochrome [Neolewinella sp.]|uniref:c-type cytochrome n=1 Tax=Neolewinella sp. TaxID=2993543 RepID=UPI003B525DEB